MRRRNKLINLPSGLSLLPRKPASLLIQILRHSPNTERKKEGIKFIADTETDKIV
jgi:hypothetical protein